METAQRRGTDVVLVLDTSASMRAADVTPSVSFWQRQAAHSLLGLGFGKDRAALIACEGEAQALVPLTLDAGRGGSLPGRNGTGHGRGSRRRRSALIHMRWRPTSSRPDPRGAGRASCSLLAGEDLEGGVDGAAARAKAEGIIVHAGLRRRVDGSGAPVPDPSTSSAARAATRVTRTGSRWLSPRRPTPRSSSAPSRPRRESSFTVGGAGRNRFRGGRPGRSTARRAGPSTKSSPTRPEGGIRCRSALRSSRLGLLLTGALGREEIRGTARHPVPSALLRRGKRGCRGDSARRRRGSFWVRASRLNGCAISLSWLLCPASLWRQRRLNAGARPASQLHFLAEFLSFSPFRSGGRGRLGPRGEEARRRPGRLFLRRRWSSTPAEATGNFNRGVALSRCGEDTAKRSFRSRRRARRAAAASRWTRPTTRGRRAFGRAAESRLRLPFPGRHLGRRPERLRMQPGTTELGACGAGRGKRRRKEKEQQKDKKDKKDDKEKKDSQGQQDDQQAGSEEEEERLGRPGEGVRAEGEHDARQGRAAPLGHRARLRI